MIVYKYRNLDKVKRDLKSLKRNQIYASKFTDLNDPFEALFDEQITRLAKTLENRALSGIVI